MRDRLIEEVEERESRNGGRVRARERGREQERNRKEEKKKVRRKRESLEKRERVWERGDARKELEETKVYENGNGRRKATGKIEEK